MDREYWEDRGRKFGARAAGYQDAAMDAYEDRLRRAAIMRLVGEGRGRALLDAGCGSGRWSVRMAEAGWTVTGVDFSRELIALAPAAPHLTYVTAAIQDVDLPASSFDAWLSVTALQHITADEDFEAALDNLTRMLRPQGAAAVLEYAPLVALSKTPAYLRVRSRRQWIDALVAHGYELRAETGVRFTGHVPYMLLVRLLRRLGRAPETLNWLRSVCQALDLALARIPGLTLAGDVRLMVFARR